MSLAQLTARAFRLGWVMDRDDMTSQARRAHLGIDDGRLIPITRRLSYRLLETPRARIWTNR